MIKLMRQHWPWSTHLQTSHLRPIVHSGEHRRVVQRVGWVVIMSTMQICRWWQRRLSLHGRTVLVVCKLRSGNQWKSQPSVQVRASIQNKKGLHCHRSIIIDKTKQLEAFVVYLFQTSHQLDAFKKGRGGSAPCVGVSIAPPHMTTVKYT
jgi:hypothetical protein